MSIDPMPSINSFMEQRRDTNFYISLMNYDAKKIPIGKLLNNMDSDGNKNVSTDELYKGLVENYSNCITTFSEAPKQMTLEEKAQYMGIDKSIVTDNIEEGIDLNDTIGSFSKFLGLDLKEVMTTANKFGIAVDLEELSINDVNDILDKLEELTKSPEAQKVLKYGAKTHEEYLKGNKWATAKNAAVVWKNLYKLNQTDETIAEYTDKIVESFATDCKRKIRNKLGGNNVFAKGAGKATEFIVEHGGKLLLGTHVKRVKNFFSSIF